MVKDRVKTARAVGCVGAAAADDKLRHTPQGGDDLWFVKENQPTLYEDVQRFFQLPETRRGWSRPPLPQNRAYQWNKAHGRLEYRALTAIIDETAYLDWPAVAQVLKIERRSQVLSTGTWRDETSYAITSLPPERASSQRLLQLARQRWGILRTACTTAVIQRFRKTARAFRTPTRRRSRLF